jgi:septal ring factor EnvC (AmiA/AmiB activator)
MSIDDRLRFLVTSTESLHAQSQELHQTVARQADEQVRLAAEQARQFQRSEKLNQELVKHQRAMIAAMRAYLEGME